MRRTARPRQLPGRGAVVAALTLGAALCIGGCGAGQAPAKDAPPTAPSYEQQQYPTLGEPGGQEYGQPPGSPGLQPPPQPNGTAPPPRNFAQPPEPTTLEGWESLFERNAQALASDFQCMDACRALQSLERAQKRICEILSGGDDPERRCERARERVAAAKSRVESQCDCPATP